MRKFTIPLMDLKSNKECSLLSIKCTNIFYKPFKKERLNSIALISYNLILLLFKYKTSLVRMLLLNSKTEENSHAWKSSFLFLSLSLIRSISLKYRLQNNLSSKIKNMDQWQDSTLFFLKHFGEADTMVTALFQGSFLSTSLQN